MIYQKPSQPPSGPGKKRNDAITVIVISASLLAIFFYVAFVAKMVEGANQKEAANKKATAAKELERAQLNAEQKRKADAEWLVKLAESKAELNGYAAIDASQGPLSVDWDRWEVRSGVKSRNSDSVLVWTEKQGKALIAGTMVRVRGYAEVQCWVPKAKDDKIVCLPLEASVKGT
jgi:hypothetical protein